MIRIQRILVPVDFSEPSRKAANYGLALARQYDARLILVHIVPTSVGFNYAFPPESFVFEKEQYDQAKQLLPALIPEDDREAVRLTTVVKAGDVRKELFGIIQDEAADLIVMGTHGRNAVERFMLGSLTERILRQVPIPILTVSHVKPAKEPHDQGPVPLRHLLYATDLSEGNAAGLKFSIDLARGAGARLTVLHVIQQADAVYWGANMGAYTSLDMEKLREDAMDRLRYSIPEEWCTDVKVTPILAEGNPFREIVRFTEEQNVDMIVMNLQNKGRLERALLGSTAERVIRSATVPVLSLPVPAEYESSLIMKDSNTAA
jgi:nucleotide-binding universal stress UspA family protein